MRPTDPACPDHQDLRPCPTAETRYRVDGEERCKGATAVIRPMTTQAQPGDRTAAKTRTPSSPVVVLATLIAGIGAATAAVTGLLTGPAPVSFNTARGQTVDL